MALLDYMTYDDVRAALGVSSDEITDATLSLDLYSNGLDQEIDDISPTLGDEYLVIKDLDLDGMSPIQKSLYKATRLYAVYALARQQLGTALAMFAPKDITDGKTATGRASGATYEETLANVTSYYEGVRKRLVQVYKDFKSEGTTETRMQFLGISSPSTDPVTG